MKKILLNGLNLWQFEMLSQERGISHFVTDRKSSVGKNEFTLSYSSVPDRREVENNRGLLAGALGISDSRLYFPSQVHKTKVVRVTSETSKEALQETDALMTNEPGICIAVMSADCVPILLYDKKNKAVGAVHAGWRGTVAKILEITLQEMKGAFGTNGKDLVAGIGPSVCQDSYEVGEEVIAAFDQAFGMNRDLMVPQSDNKAKLDLWKANKIQLVNFGVSPANIEISDLCTVKNNTSFFSARRGDAGRFAAGIMLI